MIDTEDRSLLEQLSLHCWSGEAKRGRGLVVALGWVLLPRDVPCIILLTPVLGLGAVSGEGVPTQEYSSIFGLLSNMEYAVGRV